ncbi:MAG TPA: C25 family cysteine peptidase, partial [Acidobacteriota bacterium]|nr:C25 family cysteine peptidase [Acidobacteriota bacterium]
EPSAGFPNVTLELRNDQGRVIARTATDANGYYLFDGLPIDPAGSAYEVVITDTANVLAGYQMTTDPNLLHVILYRNSPETRHRRDADAGYRYQATNVSLKRFDAFAVGATVVLEWETAMEFETAGFQVLRATGPDAAPTPINTVLVPAMYESINGGIYRLADHGASAEGVHTYWLKELERAGAVRIYGPFRRSPQAAPPGLGIPDPYSREARPGNRLRRPTGERLSAGHAWEPHGSALAASKPVESGAIPAAAARAPKQGSDRRDNGHRKGAASLINQEAFKIPVTQTGMHFVSAEQIAEEMNISLGIVRRLLVQGQIAVTNMGQTAATWIPSDLSGIYFFGEASDSLYSRENIYWVRRAAGLAMQKLPASPHQSKVVTTFRESITLEQDVEMSPAATTDPNGEYWFWCYMHGGIPGENEEVIVFDAPGATGAAAAPATLQVFVHASTNLVPGNDHSIAASLNGVQVGVSEWDGIGPHSFVCTFDQAILRETGNELRLRAEALNESPVSVVWLDRIDLGYQRLLRAVDDSLIFNADKGRIQVEGFSGESIAVFEITDPSRPKRVVPVSTQPSGQTFSVVFHNASEQARFLALTLEAAWQPTPRADFPSSLKKVQGAEYVIITTRELSEPARALAEHRQHQGWTTMVADVKDVMDEFNHGNVNPSAIRDFLEYALSKWEKPLRFVVLAGKGSLDYRDLKGQGSNLIPPLVVGTPYGITASDTALADVDGDFVPDVAIGRLPAENTEGLEILVRKIISYEEASSGAWQNRVLLAADKPDPRVGDFRAYSDTLARLLPNGFIALKAYPSELESPREQILAGLNAGCGLFSYVGHGSADQLASEGRLFQISDLEQLTNKSFLPVFVGLTCYVGAFVDPGWDCMAERMVKVGNGGAIAALTSSWLAPNASNMAFGAQVFRARFYGGCETIGEAFREAYQASAMTGVPGYVLSIFNVFGDPATPIR